MLSRFWKRLASWPDRPAHPFALAALVTALVVAVIGGVRLGNSAIADINPVHYRGAIVHPRDRGAAVAEHQARARQPTYAALYGWDEGRAAQEAERARVEQEFTPPPPRRHDAAIQAWSEPAAPRAFRVAIHRGKDGVDRYHYQRQVDRDRESGQADRSGDRRREDRSSYRGQDYRAGDIYLPRGDEALEVEDDGADVAD